MIQVRARGARLVNARQFFRVNFEADSCTSSVLLFNARGAKSKLDRVVVLLQPQISVVAPIKLVQQRENCQIETALVCAESQT